MVLDMKTTKNKIKAALGVRVLFFVFAIGLAGTLWYTGTSEKKRTDQWKTFQEVYKKTYEDILSVKIKEAEASGKKDDLEKWNDLSKQVKMSETKMNVVFLPEAQSRDLCTTCHVSIENPLFKDQKNPLKSHPQEILRHHQVSRFGCTLCHHGQGVGLTQEKAHGYEANWESPRIPLKYAQSSCLECHESVYGLKGAEKASAGRTIFMERGCYGCHDANVMKGLPKFSTPFNVLSRKISSRTWVVKWVENPQKIRPETLMPAFRLDQKQREDVAEYLMTMKDDTAKPMIAANLSGSAALGKKTFAEKACAACHSDVQNKKGLTRRVPLLGDAGLKMNPNWVYNWITDPRAINPDTWMPKLELLPEDVKNLTAYLRTLESPQVRSLISFKIHKGDAANGKNLAQSKGCLGCHLIMGKPDTAKVGINVSDIANKRMEELPFGTSKVPYTKWDWIYNKIMTPAIYKTQDMPMSMPDFGLNSEEVSNLTVFYLFNKLKNLPSPYLVRENGELAEKEKGEWMLTHFNCKGCHSVLEKEVPRIDAYLEKKSMVPPRIVDEMDKVKPEWLYGFLNRPVQLRPWLQIRMPMFNLNDKDKETLIVHLHNLMSPEKQAEAPIPYQAAMVKADYSKEILDMGEYRFRSDKCMQCHPVSFTGVLPEGKSLEDMSIDLMMAKSRLRLPWLKDFLRNPDKYAGAGTKMPFVFYTPDKAPRIPDPEAWIERTALYVMFMDKVPEPMKEEETTRKVENFDFEEY
jgi:mono/diheme cytochrome c family protein